jgi:hypothetical protein
MLSAIGVSPMRKLLLTWVCFFGMTGIVFAADITLLKHDADRKEVTVKDGEKEVVYKYNDKTKVTFIDKDLGTSREGSLDAAIKLLNNQKFIGKKFEVVTDKDSILEFKIKLKKKN